MKCKNCGKRLKKKELFCKSCGFYNGTKNMENWDAEGNLLDEDLNSDSLNFTLEEDIDSKEYSYEDEDLVESYIGDDYKNIKKGIFNIWAFLLNWMYFLYRKMFLTGILGLAITLFVILFFRKYLLIYAFIIMIIIGFTFNKYYIMIAKKKVKKIKEKEEFKDNSSLNNLCMEKGGYNLPLSLIIYFIFLVIVFFCLVPIQFNRSHNSKYWGENSDNRATCLSIIKTVYSDIEEDKNLGTAKEAACRIIKNDSKEYEVYIKTTKESITIYSFYSTENNHVMFKKNTLNQQDLELRKIAGDITPEEEVELSSLKEISSNYLEIEKKSEVEEQLIKDKKNTEERLHFIFDREEIIR